MQYNLTKNDGEFKAEITFDEKEWNDAINSAYEKNKGKYNIPGFRKGHAPRAVIEQNYGTGAFMNDALDEVYYKAYTTILREHTEVEPIDSPKLDIKKFDEKGVEFVLTIPVVPEFTLASYKGLTFTKQKVEVTDEQIKNAIDRELLRASRLVESKNPVKDKDFVVLDFDGYVDGKQFDGGKAENYQLQIGSHTFIDNFEEQLIGLNIGDKKDVEVTFPENYQEKTLAGKKAVFKCEIKNVRERIMPELNAEFVSNSTEFETVEDYKASIKEKLIKEEERRVDMELDNDILDKIIDDTEVKVPESLVDSEFNRQLNGMEQQMKYQGITLEDYAAYLGKSLDDVKEDIKKASTRNVKARLVLEKLLKDEKIDITNEDIDNKLKEMAKNVGKSFDDYKKEVNNDMVNRIANELIMKKLMNFLHEHNTIK